MADEVAHPLSHLHIRDEAFQYLAIQRGKIAEHASDRVRWTQAYIDSLMADFTGMLPHLPKAADRILDVGSGMGGIDILLAKHFHQPEVWLLDGDDDSPVMVKHAQTFNCMQTARRFLTMNGVLNIVCSSPGMEVQPAPCNLVVSLQSWCFHYNPEVYLPFVLACCVPGTILILDVRKDYKTWYRVLEAKLRRIETIYSGAKFERVVFRAE